MTKNKKRILVAIILVALLLAVLGGLAAWYTGVQNSYSRHIALGEKYFSEGDYTNAALSYQRAIEQKPEEEEGYLGLVRIYTSQGQDVMAQSILRIGIDRTGSARLALMLEEFLGSGVTDGRETASTVPKDKGEGTGTLDLALLTALRDTEFNEYRIRRGIASADMTDEGTCRVRVNDVAAELLYTAKGVDRIMERPLAESRPAQAHLDDIASLLGGRQSVTLEELRKMGAETPTLAQDDDHGYVVQFTANGCTVTVESDKEGTVHSGAWNVIDFPSAEDQLEAGSCHISGKVINAVTGSGVSGAEVKVYSGSQTGGTPVKSLTTDSFGSYELGLDSGSYTAQVVCNGYTTETFSFYVGSISALSGNDFVISPTLTEGQIRIVLEWGNYPPDLDSYLNGTLDDGTSVRTSYRQKRCTVDGTLVAELDVDDTNGNGPETTTIYNSNGKFTFTVVDFNGTGEMSNSGATVKVYLPGESAPTVINICGGLENGWSVCEIDHGEVRVINGPAPTTSAPNK